MPLLPPTADHWPAVRTIYAEDMATGTATLATEPPTWEVWPTGHRPTGRLAIADETGVVGAPNTAGT